MKRLFLLLVECLENYKRTKTCVKKNMFTNWKKEMSTHKRDMNFKTGALKFPYEILGCSFVVFVVCVFLNICGWFGLTIGFA